MREEIYMTISFVILISTFELVKSFTGSEEDIQRAFKFIDTTKDGVIDAAELFSLPHHVGNYFIKINM